MKNTASIMLTTKTELFTVAMQTHHNKKWLSCVKLQCLIEKVSGVKFPLTDFSPYKVLLISILGKCTNIRAGSRFAFSCKCHVDFEGDLCQLRKPYSCEQKPCKNDAACVERGGQGVFECICKVGYGGTTCQYFYGMCLINFLVKVLTRI